MINIKLPYGKEYIEFGLPEERLLGILESKAAGFESQKSQEEIVTEALENPIGSPRLKDLARGKKNIVVITSDHTRPVPSHITLPLMLDEIRKGNPDAHIKLLIATGFHRPTSREEMAAKFGQTLVNREHFVVHDSRKAQDMVEIGILPSGGRLEINRLAVEADLLVSDGFIEPHFFAGFSGGRKSILPGIAGHSCIMANHCAQFIASPHARTGILEENPIHRDMLYAAEKANLAFILNVVIDGEHKIISAFAGHREHAHLKGCGFVKNMAAVKAKTAHIAITSNGGYPLDQNIYQAVKGMTAAEAACRQGGVIIIAAQCADGHGGEGFYRWFKDSPGPEEVMHKILARSSGDTLPDQWEAQILARVLMKHKVIMVTDTKNHGIVRDMHMTPASTIQEALSIAEAMVGHDSTINVIPDGVSVIVTA